MRSPILVLCTMLLSTTWLVGPAAGIDNLETLRESIEATSDQMIRATIAGDLATLMSFYTDDVVVLPNYQAALRGRAAVERNEREMRAAGYEIHSLDFVTEELWTCGDEIYEIGTYGISLTVPDLSHPIADAGKYLTVWQRDQAGGLKIKVEIWNSDLHPSQLTVGD